MYIFIYCSQLFSRLAKPSINENVYIQVDTIPLLYIYIYSFYIGNTALYMTPPVDINHSNHKNEIELQILA